MHDRDLTFEQDYARVTRHLRDMERIGSKITAEARHRIAAQSLAAQLADLRKEMKVPDQSDIDFALNSDWSEP